ncbi:uncharacterized protein C2845_PM11G06170 [Panicum miliaceum]|uniref:Retrotransposon gag domain-containing protein n=1 Tax=Panicum miliaceum TaxID=4540 RepID=A0A3L6RN36_PANMI|nr:uncharacterized protein C2845_PM11G06170 [Panicum miliaceum]
MMATPSFLPPPHTFKASPFAITYLSSSTWTKATSASGASSSTRLSASSVFKATFAPSPLTMNAMASGAWWTPASSTGSSPRSPKGSSTSSAAIAMTRSLSGTPCSASSMTNELQRTVYLEAELRTLQQGDMTINAYCTKLKRLTDQLRDIGHPVSEPSQVLNLLHGLNPKYRYVKPVITSKYPPHTFMSARSFLILEELGADHDATAEAGQALIASHGDRSGGNSTNAAKSTNDGSSGSTAPRNNPRSNNNRANNRSDRRRGRGGGGGSSRQDNPNGQNAPWTAGYNP